MAELPIPDTLNQHEDTAIWETFAEKHRKDQMYRNAIDTLADQHGDKTAHAIKATVSDAVRGSGS